MTNASFSFSEGHSHQPTAQLRWKAGKLQQLWLLRHYRNGAIYHQAEEWRDVPEED